MKEDYGATPSADAFTLRAAHVIDWAGGALAAVVRHEEQLNEINVFEVPDGDTGTNLVRTLGYGCAAIADLPAEVDAERACATFGESLWRNASGCSGLILAATLKALLGVLAEQGQVDAQRLVAALDAAAVAAASAVAKPAPGTMVTVAQDAYHAARVAEPSLVAIASSVRAAVRAAVERSPSELPALFQTGVVDSGALGLRLVFEALFDVLPKE
jgi:dihydroxyacetone kinase-like predicted kinase